MVSIRKVVTGLCLWGALALPMQALALPPGAAVAPGVQTSNANLWTGVQTFANSVLKLLGSSTGSTTITSANASATNYTATLPAATDTIAELAQVQTFTAPNTFTALQNIAEVNLTGGTLPTNGVYYVTKGVGFAGNGVQLGQWDNNGPRNSELLIGNSSNTQGGDIYVTKYGYGNFGHIFFGGGDAAIYADHISGVSDPYASLMFGDDEHTYQDCEPDFHCKGHAQIATNSFTAALTFNGSASSSNCGSGAVIEYGSNDDAGRIIMGSGSPTSCAVLWQHAYANERTYSNPSTPNGFVNTPPGCSARNEGVRATGTINFTGNAVNTDTLTIEGVPITFVTGTPTGNQVQIGATAALTTTNLFLFLIEYNTTPGVAPSSMPVLAHYQETQPTSTSIQLTYTYLDGVTGNAVALSTSDPTNISVPANLSGGALPAAANAVQAICGTGGMVITGTLIAGQVVSYGLPHSYW
jgi:hypothetical protein